MANWTDVAVRGQRVVTAGRLRAVVDVYDLGVTDGKGGRYDVHQYYDSLGDALDDEDAEPKK